LLSKELKKRQKEKQERKPFSHKKTQKRRTFYRAPFLRFLG